MLGRILFFLSLVGQQICQVNTHLIMQPRNWAEQRYKNVHTVEADLIERQQLCQSQRGSEGGYDREMALFQLIEEDFSFSSLKPKNSDLIM